MQVDYLIIGQGLCGTLLSWFLHKEGKSFLVVDDGNENNSSMVAAGVINPATGRRYTYTWMVEELLPFARQTYGELGAYLDSTFLVERSIIDFFPTPQMRNAFVERITEDDRFLHAYPDQNRFNNYFNHDFGCGEIRPACNVHISQLLAAWRKKLVEKHAFRKEQFQPGELRVIAEGITYGDVTASKAIFCEGKTAVENPWFSLLPFSPTKGEALLIECEGLTNEHIFKRGLTLVPMAAKDTYWVGSNYQWKFEDEYPSTAFYNQATTILNNWLKMPYRILSHKAAVRPATVERRPFVGLHPQHPELGILNGMGTKGTSLGPFFAHQLVQHIIHGLPLTPNADVHRFSRVLSRKEA